MAGCSGGYGSSSSSSSSSTSRSSPSSSDSSISAIDDDRRKKKSRKTKKDLKNIRRLIVFHETKLSNIRRRRNKNKKSKNMSKKKETKFHRKKIFHRAKLSKLQRKYTKKIEKNRKDSTLLDRSLSNMMIISGNQRRVGSIHTISPSLTSSSLVYGNDVCEPSPNSMAKCRTCGFKILKRDSRIGKWTHVPDYNNHIYYYYHERCVSESFKRKLKLPDPKIQRERNVTIFSRNDLREQLRGLRSLFARRIQVPAYCIFKNKTLDDITVRLPQTKTDLVACHGIKETKYQNFGSAILTIIKQYYSWHNNPTNSQYYCSTADGRSYSTVHDDDSMIAVAGTLTCDEIVNRKLRHAEENGYIIEL